MATWWVVVIGNLVFNCGDPSLEKWSRSEPISFAIYIINQYDIPRWVEISFAKSCKHQQNRVVSLSCFSSFYRVFLCLHQPGFTVAELCDDNACRIWNGIVQPARSPIYADSMSNWRQTKPVILMRTNRFVLIR